MHKHKEKDKPTIYLAERTRLDRDCGALLKKIMKKVVPISQPVSRQNSPRKENPQYSHRRGSDAGQTVNQPLRPVQNSQKQQKDSKQQYTIPKQKEGEDQCSLLEIVAKKNSLIDHKSKVTKKLDKNSHRKQSIVHKFLNVTQSWKESEIPESYHQAKQSPRQAETLSKASFNFRKVIGRGGFGRVWKTQHKGTHREYAIKEMSKAVIISRKSVPSIMNERELLEEMHSNFIVNMVAAFQDREYLCLVLDLMPGGDLRTLFSRVRRFSQSNARFYIACVIQALEYIHQLNIIHRDIKPENLVLDKYGYVHVTDFGIARKLRPDNQSDTSGTPGYMAPEVMCRQKHSFEADYFAVGVLAYELMLCKRPYHGHSRKEIRDDILARQVQIRHGDLPEGWSPEAGDFVNRLLQRKPANRLGFNGASQVKKHPWFRGFNWQQLIRGEVKAPKLIGEQMRVEWGQQGQSELVEQNRILLRRDSVQAIFKGYQKEAHFM